MMRSYGRPDALLRVSRLGSLDGFDYVAFAACPVQNGTMITSAKAKSVVEAKIIADALGKYVRHMAQRKARKDARRDIKRGSVERELVGGGGEEGGAR